MNLVFDPRVEDDLAEAAGFYESRSEGLGEDFLAEFRRTLDAIASGPARGQLVDGGPVRRSLLSRFPYAVYYHSRIRRAIARPHRDAWAAAPSGMETAAAVRALITGSSGAARLRSHVEFSPR